MRRAIVYIHTALLKDWFRQGHEIRVRCVEGFPSHSTICGVHPAPDRDAVAVVVESPLFDDIEAGQPLPVIQPKFERL